MNDTATAGAERAPAPVDMSGVDPARWPEIRRRVAILDDFVALYRPACAVRTAFARRMGLSVSQFLTLARVWRITRSASAIPGARSRNAAAGARRLPARSLEVMHKAIDALGPMARRKDVLAEVGRVCAEEAIEAPSASTIANALAAARARMDTDTDFAPEILIDECVAKLPVANGAAVSMPRILLAVALPQRRILAAEVSFDPLVAPAQTALIDTLGQIVRNDVPALPIRAPHHPNLGRGTRSGGGSAPPGGPTMERILGNRLGDLEIVHRPSLARPAATLVSARHASALDPHDAATAIRMAIATHNAKVPPLPGQVTPVRRTPGSEGCPAPAGAHP